MDNERSYIAIDLKSFYASVECVDRGLDPLDVNLVVADPSRTEKTICLAVSPALKAHGISGRARLFEAIEGVRNANGRRIAKAPGHSFSGKSSSDRELKADPSLEIDFITAPPRMARYMEVSSYIYSIYMKYVAPEDLHIYSVDEVFMDVTAYLNTYNKTPHELAITIIRDVLNETGITATAGIGTNLYLAKIAMDIVAKHMPADKDGVRIAELDEMSYRRILWNHRPITDFWRVGRGYAKKLAAHGLYTMGDIARCSVGKKDDYYNEDLLYRLFGINAELLIDHAWGWEPCLISDIKAYKPTDHSISQGQVLSCGYDFEKGRIVVTEMTDLLSLDLVKKRLVTDQMVLTVGYDIDNLNDPDRRKKYHGPVETDYYGRTVPKAAHGSINLGGYTSSSAEIIEAVQKLWDEIVDPALLIRRMYVVANHAAGEEILDAPASLGQIDMFTDVAAIEAKKEAKEAARQKEKRLQESILSIKERYGKNSILRGMNYLDGATMRERNEQVGGHKA
ncbi:MAG: DNA methylase [Lachnospiraceae bacterium]|nr:DNA methylase [Lachnospiraceae bacterium]